MVDFLAQVSPSVAYLLLYIGIIFTGGAALLAGMLFSFAGKLNIFVVFAVTVLAALTADATWYFIGWRAKKDKLYSYSFVQKRVEEARAFSRFFERHGVALVFFTKFIWGTRIASHVLAGMHKVPFFRFVMATTLGTATWFVLFFFILKGVDASIAAAKATALRLQLICLIFFALGLVLNWFTGTYVRRRILK
jgi:membrane protein DedA with SNARE-associated domain